MTSIRRYFPAILPRTNTSIELLLRKNFKWNIPSAPEGFNIGTACIDYHVFAGRGHQPAVICHRNAGSSKVYSFSDVKHYSDLLGSSLGRQYGLSKGDCVGICIPQSIEAVLAHIAVYKMGCIAVPLFSLFGADALKYRVEHCQAKIVIASDDQLPKLTTAKNTELINSNSLWDMIRQEKDVVATAVPFIAEKTGPDDPAVILYTSGTTGNPKAVVHAHRVLLGHLPGIELPHNGFPQECDIFWTPADWAWIGGLFDVLLPSLYYGIPVVAHRLTTFHASEAIELIARYHIRNVFFPPAALRILMKEMEGIKCPPIKLRSIGTGGERLSEEVIDWSEKILGVIPNEFYGQTECNLIVGNSAGLIPRRMNSIGMALPGHDVEIFTSENKQAKVGETGEICVKSPDPAMFLGYLKDPPATEAKFFSFEESSNKEVPSRWMRTGDIGWKDIDGYFYFESRSDDVTKISGYRVGPWEVEQCVEKHPLVESACAISVKSDRKGSAIKVFVVLKPHISGGARVDDLLSEVSRLVVEGLGPHAKPSAVEILSELPRTITGKLQRKTLKEREESIK